MSEFLCEIYCEEIPARLQKTARQYLQSFFAKQFSLYGLSHSSIESFSSPRRLVIHVENLQAIKKGFQEEKRGPRENAPDKALDGFCQSNQINKSDLILKNTDKGRFYFAIIQHREVHTKDLLPSMIVKAIESLPWPKSMKWAHTKLRFIRPIHNILCLFNGQQLAGSLSLGVDSVEEPIIFSDVTYGHTTNLMKSVFKIKNFSHYQQIMSENNIVFDHTQRRKIIVEAAQNLAKKHHLICQEDDHLLEEVIGLVEWPNLLLGKIDDAYMSLPANIIINVMKTHQKYMALLTEKGNISPYFLIIANLTADDGGKTICAGNERVLRARLADAQFFIEQDQKVDLEKRTDELKNIVFHEELGTIWDKTQRLKKYALILQNSFSDINPDQAHKTIDLLKADLTSQLVGELPELQGQIGAYYAQKQNIDLSIAAAIQEHYLPEGPEDSVPSKRLSILMALIDKIDNVVCFFAIDQKPTGSKDPFALRRNALGILRILIDNKISISFVALLKKICDSIPDIVPQSKKGRVIDDVFTFLRERLNVMLKADYSYDVIDAITHSEENDDFYQIYEKVSYLHKFIRTDNGQKLVAAFKRTSNILQHAQKQEPHIRLNGIVCEHLISQDEKALYEQIGHVEQKLDPHNFSSSLNELTDLTPYLDKFFDNVMVNDENATYRQNRLSLLNQTKSLIIKYMDLSKIVKNSQ